MSDKIWGTTETGSTFHSFKADGTAECRKSIKMGGSFDGQAESRIDNIVHASPNVFRKCARCTKLEAEFRARVEASMAPVNAYDQVCEGVVTDEGAAKAAESDVEVAEVAEVAEVEVEVEVAEVEVAEVEVAEVEVGDVYQVKRGGGLRATVREVRHDAGEAVVIFSLNATADNPSPSRFNVRLSLKDFQNVWRPVTAETDTAAPTVRDALLLLRARRAEMTGNGLEPDWAQAFDVLESEGLFAQYDN